MKTYKITKKTAKILDYIFCTIAIVFAFLVDWKAGVMLIAFDIMRGFESIQEKIENNNDKKNIIDIIKILNVHSSSVQKLVETDKNILKIINNIEKRIQN